MKETLIKGVINMYIDVADKSKPTISNVLRLLRIANDLSAKELSEKSGISSSYISELENGIRLTPSSDILDKYSKALHISKQTILFFQEEFDDKHYSYQQMLYKILQQIAGD